MVKGFKDGKGTFHPITQSKGVRSRRDTSQKPVGMKIERNKRYAKTIVNPKTTSDESDFILDLRIQKLRSINDDLEFAKKEEGITTFEGISSALREAEKEQMMRTNDPKTQTQLSDFITRKFNKEIPSAKNNPFRNVNFREIEKVGKNTWRFRVSLTSGDDVAVKEIQRIGFRTVEIRDILDSRHATFEGDLGLG